MGTRSLTFVYGGTDRVLVNMYRQFDGYPEGHGAELAEFLNSFDEITNGIRVGETRKIANGMGCLAAQMIAHFKDGAGGIYLESADNNDCWQEYEYHVYEDYVRVTDPGAQIFRGSWSEFAEWCKNPETVE